MTGGAMNSEEVIRQLEGMLIVNHKEREAVRYAVDAIRRLEKYKSALNKIMYDELLE
jgi:hypothetical protein